MLEGMDEIERNIAALIQQMHQQAGMAADECAMFLANWAKTHHGNTPRKAGWVYPPGAKRRWRVAGTGWGDVTGNLNNSTQAGAERTAGGYRVVLSAGMEYGPYVELNHGKRWSWLWPAVMEMVNSGKAMEIFRRHLELR